METKHPARAYAAPDVVVTQLVVSVRGSFGSHPDVNSQAARVCRHEV